MNSDWTIADADGDIAALVYSSRDRPDLVLYAFARYLRDAGRRVCGLVQFRDRSRNRPPGRVMVLDSWQLVDVASRPDAVGDGNCRLDAHWLNQMGTRAEASIRRGVDTVIVNRFGPLEANGRGFSNAIVVASETKTPLIIAVPEFEFERWTRFSRGMTVRLDCKLDKVLDWWTRVASSSPSGVPLDARTCEVFK